MVEMRSDVETVEGAGAEEAEREEGAVVVSSPESLEALGVWPEDWVERASVGPWELDLGSARGHFLVAAAAAWPERFFLGLEWQAHRVRFTRRKLHRQGLANARVVRGEILTLLREKIPAAAVARVHVLFPDPWPKRRHARRRLLQPEGLAAIAHVTKPGGEFRFLTDAEPYHQQALALLQSMPQWKVSTTDPRAGWPASEFQARFEKMGQPVYGWVAERTAVPMPPSPTTLFPPPTPPVL
jgi:tRNA (guanine-N7-)-methyltransferase